MDHPKFHGEDHIILDKELEAFLKATLELHFVPGINPHNRCETAPAQVISIAPLTMTGPYWWAIPGLGAGIIGNIRADLKRGASTYEWGTPVVVWVRPGVVIPSRWRDIYIQR